MESIATSINKYIFGIDEPVREPFFRRRRRNKHSNKINQLKNKIKGIKIPKGGPKYCANLPSDSELDKVKEMITLTHQELESDTIDPDLGKLEHLYEQWRKYNLNYTDIVKKSEKDYFFETGRHDLYSNLKKRRKKEIMNMHLLNNIHEDSSSLKNVNMNRTHQVDQNDALGPIKNTLNYVKGDIYMNKGMKFNIESLGKVKGSVENENQSLEESVIKGSNSVHVENRKNELEVESSNRIFNMVNSVIFWALIILVSYIMYKLVQTGTPTRTKVLFVLFVFMLVFIVYYLEYMYTISFA